MFTRSGYVESPDDPALLYQDVVVSLGGEGPFNNGQPTLHAACVAALNVKRGERVVHVGAGTGYYTTLLAKLVGETGSVDAYEVVPEFARRAAQNLGEFSYVVVHARSGAEGPLPACDVLYVNAGATEPLEVWLDALLPGGRLLFPMTPADGSGAMLLVVKNEESAFAARFLMQVQFVPCIGARDETTAHRLADAFRDGKWTKVKALHRNEPEDESCWVAGDGWWLSTR
jgi:protein-L-isoaspartate(D-aspartate) O-methyltransferase